MVSFGKLQNPSKLSLFFSKLTSKINKKVKVAFALLLFVDLGMFLYNAYQRAYESFIYDKETYIIYWIIIENNKNLFM